MTNQRDRLWLTYEEILADAAERIFDITNRNIQRSTLRHWASMANREFARRSEILRDTFLTALVANQDEYELPTDLIRIRMVAAKFWGYTGEQIVYPENEEEWLDGTDPPTGTPYWYFLSYDRRRLVLRDMPNQGGFVGSVDAAVDTTHFDGPSTMSDTDDFYNGMTVRMVNGNDQDEERTISDYDGTTKRVTVSSAFTNGPAAEDDFQIYPDTLRVEYIKGGNSYAVLPTAGAIIAGASTLSRTSFETNLAQKERDYYEGLELKFTSGGNIGFRTQILTSQWRNAATDHTLVTVSPALPVKPAAAEGFIVVDVPNIPPAYHDALVSYVVHKALQRMRDPQAQEHLAAFLEGVQEATERDRPAIEQEFKQIREYGIGEEESW